MIGFFKAMGIPFLLCWISYLVGYFVCWLCHHRSITQERRQLEYQQEELAVMLDTIADREMS